MQHQKACRNIPLLFQGHRCRGTPDREHTDDGLDLPASVVQKVRDVDRRGYFTTDNQPGQRHSWLRPPGRAQATAPPCTVNLAQTGALAVPGMPEGRSPSASRRCCLHR